MTGMTIATNVRGGVTIAPKDAFRGGRRTADFSSARAMRSPRGSATTKRKAGGGRTSGSRDRDRGWSRDERPRFYGRDRDRGWDRDRSDRDDDRSFLSSSGYRGSAGASGQRPMWAGERFSRSRSRAALVRRQYLWRTESGRRLRSGRLRRRRHRSAGPRRISPTGLLRSRTQPRFRPALFELAAAADGRARSRL